ncbi:MAG: hypothetical protein WAN43_13670 [Rhodomicrobium sp.]
MGSPKRTHALRRSPLATRDFGLSLIQSGDFIRVQRRIRGQLQEEAPKVVLGFGGEAADCVDGLFEKLCHRNRIGARRGFVQKPCSTRPCECEALNFRNLNGRIPECQEITPRAAE